MASPTSLRLTSKRPLVPSDAGAVLYPSTLFGANPLGHGRVRYAAFSDAEMVHVNVVRFLLVGAIIYFLIGLRIVKAEEWLVVTRVGKYCGFRKQGIHWLVPFVDKTHRVPLSEVSASWKDMPDEILETAVHEWVSKESLS